LIIITSTTVGYGDIYPHTIGGQIVCIITAFWGTFIVSLLVLVVANIFELSANEKKAIKFIKQSRTAATAIGNAFKFYLKKKKFYVQKMDHDPNFSIESSTFLTKMYANAKSREADSGSLTSRVVKFQEAKEESSTLNLFKKNLSLKVRDAYQVELIQAYGVDMNCAYKVLVDSLKEFSDDQQSYQ